MKYGKVDKKTLQGSIINTMFRDELIFIEHKI